MIYILLFLVHTNQSIASVSIKRSGALSLKTSLPLATVRRRIVEASNSVYASVDSCGRSPLRKYTPSSLLSESSADDGARSSKRLSEGLAEAHSMITGVLPGMSPLISFRCGTYKLVIIIVARNLVNVIYMHVGRCCPERESCIERLIVFVVQRD